LNVTRCLPAFLAAFWFIASAFSQATSVFRGNLAHTGVYDAAGVPRLTGLKWKFHTGGLIISSPAIAGGLVYVGSTDGNLYAVNLNSGMMKWKFESKARIVSTPAVADGVVYFSSYDGLVYAVDAFSGKLKWSFKNAGERRFAARHIHGALPVAETMPDPFDVYLSSPAVWNGTVYFGSGDGNIYALHAATGAIKWKFRTGDVVHASPAISGGTLFVGSWDSYFYAIDATSGQEKWRFKTGEDPDIHNQVGIQSSAAIVDGTVYFGCRDSHLYALDAVTGKKRWSFSTGSSWVISSPAILNGKVYFATSDSTLLFALDARSGKQIFSLKFKFPFFSSPAIAGNRLYIGSHDGKLTAIDLTTQTRSWDFQTDASRQKLSGFTKPDGSPNYEAVYVSDFYDDMLAGIAKMQSVGTILSSPVVAGRVVYFGSNDGNLYALM
jgi:eukaryotic-like serine/threonine-protein kinase